MNPERLTDQKTASNPLPTDKRDAFSRTELRNNPIEQHHAYLTRREAADLLRVKPYTLCDWKRRGVLVPLKIGGRLLYRLADIEAALKRSIAPTATLRNGLDKPR